MIVVKFRKCDAIIDISKNNKKEIYFDSSDWSEYKTSGFYSKSIDGEILIFVVIKELPYLIFKDEKYPFIKDHVNLSLKEKENNIWELIINNKSKFKYKPYIYFPNDDDSESDVNFGLWLMSLYKNDDMLKRVIKENQ